MKFVFSLIFFTMVFCSQKTFAQKPVLNHVSINVTDLKKSSSFYRDVLLLDTIPEPFHDGKHTWFKIGEGLQLHVIQGATEASVHPKLDHLCFSVSSLANYISGLIKAGVVYEDLQGTPHAITLRPDGVHQIYFRDPDGYWIEMNDAK